MSIGLHRPICLASSARTCLASCQYKTRSVVDHLFPYDNFYVHGENIQRPARTALAVAALTRNYILSMKKESKQRQGWKKPPEGNLVVNIDASFDEDAGCGSTGVMIRDSTGGCIAASNSYVPHVVDAPMAEAYALKEGLMLAQHIGSNRIIIQSDCMEVVETMQNGGFSANSAAAIYDECWTIWKGFDNVSIEHCCREANQVAHELARRAMSSQETCIWADEPPSFVLGNLMNDVTIFLNQ